MTFEEIGTRVGKLVEEKNKAYGDSFATAGGMLKMLYPRGIMPDQYTDALALVRIWDKMKRIATNKDAFGESPYQDIAGYGILGVKLHENEQKEETNVKEKTLQKDVVDPQSCSHPNREFMNSSDDGADDKYKCDDCGHIWWVEHDG